MSESKSPAGLYACSGNYREKLLIHSFYCVKTLLMLYNYYQRFDFSNHKFFLFSFIRIIINMSKFTLKKEYISYASVTLFGLLMSALAVSAASTISTNISTAGTLTLTTSTALNSILSTNGSGVVVGTSTPTFGNLIATSTTLASTFGYNVGIASTSPYVALGVVGTTTSSLGMHIGALGSGLNQVLSGTCNLTGTVAGVQLVATSTGQFFCSVTGVNNGDKVFVSLTNGHASVWGGFVVVDAFATTTDAIGVTLLNDTGVATSSYILATTSVQYWVVR